MPVCEMCKLLIAKLIDTCSDLICSMYLCYISHFHIGNQSRRMRTRPKLRRKNQQFRFLLFSDSRISSNSVPQRRDDGPVRRPMARPIVIPPISRIPLRRIDGVRGRVVGGGVAMGGGTSEDVQGTTTYR